MSRDHYEEWTCCFCLTVNKDVRYSANSPGFYRAGQWYPDESPSIRCSRCSFCTDWFEVDSDFALQKLFQKDPDCVNKFGTPIGN